MPYVRVLFFSVPDYKVVFITNALFHRQNCYNFIKIPKTALTNK